MDLAPVIENVMDVAEASGLLMNIMWTMIGAILVYFMQAGSAMCDAGFTRAKKHGKYFNEKYDGFRSWKYLLLHLRFRHHAWYRLERNHRYQRIL